MPPRLTDAPTFLPCGARTPPATADA